MTKRNSPKLSDQVADLREDVATLKTQVDAITEQRALMAGYLNKGAEELAERVTGVEAKVSDFATKWAAFEGQRRMLYALAGGGGTLGAAAGVETIASRLFGV